MLTRDRARWILSGFILLATAVFAGLTVKKQTLIYACFSSVSYYLIFLAFLFWVISLVRSIRERRFDLIASLRSHGAGLLFSVLLAAFIFLSVKPYFRILSDEANLLAVSKSMAYERKTDNVTMGMWYYHNFYPLNRETEKRPLLFPFLTHFVHTLLGYRASNVFTVNFFVLSALFFLIFLGVKKIRGDTLAYATVMLVAAQPIVSQTATSGGIDLLAAFLVLLSFWFLGRYLEDRSGVSFQLLWATLILLSMARYESWAAVVVIIAGLGFTRNLPLKNFSSSLLYPLTPLLGLPYLWQQFIAFSKEVQFETPPGVAGFSLDHFIHQSPIFLKSLIRFDFYLPFATIINIGAIAGLLYFLFRFVSGRWPQKPQHRSFIVISGATLLTLWVIFTAYHTGDVTHPTTSRYFVLFSIVFSILFALVCGEVKALKEKPASVLLIAVALFALYHPLSVEDRYSNTQTLPRQYRDVMSLLKEQKDPNILVVAERPGLYTVHNFGAVNFAYANEHKEELLEQLKRHLFREIFVVQEIQYDTLKASAETTLDSVFGLWPLLEKENTATDFTRVSLVTINT